jgi:hypothetical protein
MTSWASRANENAPQVVAIHIVSVTLFLTNKWHLRSTAKLLTVKTTKKKEKYLILHGQLDRIKLDLDSTAKPYHTQIETWNHPPKNPQASCAETPDS